MALLEIEDLHVDFPTQGGVMHAVEGVSLTLDEGEVLGIVGESGSGKSVTMLAVLGLVAYPGRVAREAARALPAAICRASPTASAAQVVGKDVAMIFQDPTTSLNPCFTIGFQLTETLRLHLGLERKAALAPRRRSCSSKWAFPAPSSRLKDFPHQLSGGMNQRVMIAMAIACNPRLLIADEPTTALDVTIQAQILDLLRGLQRERGMALVLVTHNMGVVVRNGAPRRRDVCGPGRRGARRRRRSSRQPQHPYTAALLAAMPERSTGERRLATIPGMVPGLYDRPARLPVRSALQLRHAAHLCRSGRSCAPGPAASCAATFRWAIRDRDAAIARDRQLARPAA